MPRVVIALLAMTLAGRAVAQKPELVAQTAHYGKIGSVAFNNDGRVLATGAEDGKVKFWDVASGRQLRTLNVSESHQSVIVAFSPDGRLLASGDGNGKVNLWDVATGRLRRALPGHEGLVLSVTFSRDGKRLASSSLDHTIKVWDVDSGSEFRTLLGHIEGVVSVAFNNDGTRLASGGYDETTRLWDVDSGTQLKAFAGHPNSKGFDIFVAFSPDGKTLASGGDDGTAKLWDVATGREVQTLKTGSRISFSPDGQTLATAGIGEVKLLEVATGRVTQTFTLLTTSVPIEAIAFSPDGRELAGAASNAVKLWDVASGSALKVLRGDSLPFVSVAFSPDWRTLAAETGEKITLWDLAGPRPSQVLENSADETEISSMMISPNGKRLAARTKHGLQAWDLSAARPRGVTLNEFTDYPSTIAFSPDARMLASGAGYRTRDVAIWDANDGHLMKVLKGDSQPSDVVLAVAFGPQGRTLAFVAGEDIKIWDLVGNTPVRVLASYDGETTIRSLIFSPDGSTLVSTDFGTITVWDVATGDKKLTLDGSTAVFSPDGRTFAFEDTHQRVQLWNTSAWSQLRTLSGDSFDASIFNAGSLVFSPDSRDLAGVGANGTVRFWKVADGRELASFFPLSEGNWAVLDPEGRFDASPAGMEIMHWVVGSEPIDLAQLKNRYYEPGLLPKVLGFNLEPLHDVRSFTEVKLFPEVSVEPPSPGSTRLKMKLVNRGGGIGPVQVFVNGKELLADARGPKPDPSLAEAAITADLAGAALKPGEPNDIRVVTWDAGKNLSSRGVTIPWNLEGARDQTPPELYAIVSGISQYSSPGMQLRFASDDAAAIARALQIGGARMFGAGRVHLTLLTSPAGKAEQEATKTNLAKAFAAAAKARPGDVLVVYLAGHGVAIGERYLYPTKEAWTLGLSDTAVQAQSAISSDELAEWLLKSHATHQVMILDTCAAGAVAARLIQRRDVPADQIKAIDQLKDRTGFFVLMGSAADAASYETSQYGQGLLTYALLKGMRGPALRDGRFVDVEKLFTAVTQDVPDLAKGIGGIQQPRIALPPRADCKDEPNCNSAVTFDIGMFTPEDRLAIPLAAPKPLVSRPQFLNPQSHRDNLNLSDALVKYWRERNQSGSLAAIFIDDVEFPGAVSPSGDYSVKGGRVRINVALTRDGKDLHPITVEGAANDVDKLAAKLAAEIERALPRPVPTDR